MIDTANLSRRITVIMVIMVIVVIIVSYRKRPYRIAVPLISFPSILPRLFIYFSVPLSVTYSLFLRPLPLEAYHQFASNSNTTYSFMLGKLNCYNSSS